MIRTTRQHAFTLVELMISIAIALLLILGVNTVFKVTSQTVGAGNALLTAVRDSRTVFQTFLSDASSIDPVPSPGSTAGDGPFFVIRSDGVYAFRNAADQQSAFAPGDPRQLDPKLFTAGVWGSPPVTQIVYPDTRSHRIDRLGFFSHETFARQTTDDGVQYVSTRLSNTSDEAFVYYGHSQQPNTSFVRNPAQTSGTFWYDPGDVDSKTNNNNYYACDWMLSRVALILNPTPTSASQFYRPENSDGRGLLPIAATASSVSATTDLAATSIANFNSTSRSGGIRSYAPGGPLFGHNWWDPVINYRYQSSPFVLGPSVVSSTNPKISPATLSQCAPNLIRGCTQFIVEYAGNYYTKDLVAGDGTASATLNEGDRTKPQIEPTPDATGMLDYVMINGVTQIRWYGFPRSTSGNAGKVNVTTGDVVPLRDVLAYQNQLLSASPAATIKPNTDWATYADAERLGGLPTLANYWGMPLASYVAAWGPDVQRQGFPKLIRIIVEIDDHEGRMSQPQRYEFIYDMQ